MDNRARYDDDFHSWTREQAGKLRARAHNDIDWENVAEEIESLGRSQTRELSSRLAVLMAHLLKWEHQPQRRSVSWEATIAEQRAAISRLLQANPSLRSSLGEVASAQWPQAIARAALEMRIDKRLLRDLPVYGANAILDEEFYPGPARDNSEDER